MKSAYRNMFQRSLSFMCVLNVFVMLAGTASGEELTQISIVTPAWEYQTNEDGSGLFFDIVRHVYEPAGIKMTYQIVPWKRALVMLTDKKADAMLCALPLTAEKSGLLLPRYPMVIDYTVAVFKKATIPTWNGIETLNGKDVVWMLGYDLHKKSQLTEISVNWEEVTSHESAWRRLEAGRKADAYLDSAFDVNAYIQSNKIDMTPYQIEVLWGGPAYVAFANTERSKRLIEIYDQRIKELAMSGELEQIFTKWNLCPFSADAWAE